MMHIMVLAETAASGFVVAGMLIGMVFIAGILGIGAAFVIRIVRHPKHKDDD